MMAIKYYACENRYYFPTVVIEDLLRKERKGEFLTPEEKMHLKKYAETRRKQNSNKKKKKSR